MQLICIQLHQQFPNPPTLWLSILLDSCQFCVCVYQPLFFTFIHCQLHFLLHMLPTHHVTSNYHLHLLSHIQWVLFFNFWMYQRIINKVVEKTSFQPPDLILSMHNKIRHVLPKSQANDEWTTTTSTTQPWYSVTLLLRLIWAHACIYKQFEHFCWTLY